jgi:lysophospholipase L1-like esterase
VAAAYAAGCGKSALAPSSTIIPQSSPAAGQAVPRLALTKFFAFGDSITWGEDGRNDASEPLGRVRPFVRVAVPYPALVQAYLQTRYTAQASEFLVDNWGCRGETLTGGSGWDTGNTNGDCGLAPGVNKPTKQRFDEHLNSGKYQAVLLMEGTNDLFDADDPSGLPALVADAKAHGLTVFLATVPPEQPNPDPIPYDRSQPDANVRALNDQIRALAASQHVTLVDVYNAFPPEATTDLYGLLSRDGLHFLEAGYQLIAQTFTASIEGALEMPPAAVASQSVQR